jgi:hypothetical protein
MYLLTVTDNNTHMDWGIWTSQVIHNKLMGKSDMVNLFSKHVMMITVRNYTPKDKPN